MSVRRPYLLAAILCLGAAGACWAAYAWNGSYLDQDGVLHEQFGFIPLGWLLGLVGVVLLGLAWVRRK
jgi:cell division protein FtsX